MSIIQAIKSNALTLIFALAISSTANAQLFLETFDEGNGAMAGNDDIGGIGWTATCTTCLAGDYWEIVSGQLESQDTNGPAVWETTSGIDISSCPFIEISFDIDESGTMEGCGTGCNSVDWVQLEYNIDNTGWQTPVNSSFCAGPCADINVVQSDDVTGGPINYNTGCIPSGTSLQLRITTQTWAADEQWRIDNVTVSCSSAPTVDAGLNQQVCNGDNVTLTAFNPDMATISWNNGVNDGVAFSPSVGSLYYTVTATLGACSALDSAMVTVVPGPEFTLTSTNSSTCVAPFDGTITIGDLAPGVTYDLTYIDGVGVQGPASYTANASGEIVLTGMAVGAYNNFILDSLGCIEVNTFGVIIDPPTIPTVDAGADQTICEGSQVTLTAFNPDAGTLTWDNGVTDGVAFTPPLGTTTYTVITDVGGCTNTDSLVVTVDPQPTVNVNPAGPFALTSGVQTLTSSPAGGTWSADCGACIDPVTGDFDPAVAGIGMWTVCYTAGVAPCEDSMCVNIFVNDGCALTGIVSSNNPTCFGFADGSATINILFEVGNVTFVITDSLGNVVNTGNSNTANSLSEGWYYFSVTDDVPCTYIDSVFLDDPDQMTIDLDLVQPTCYGVPNGLAVADTVYNFSGDYNQISYIWNPNSGNNGIGEDTLFNAGGASYTLLITDENGCSETFPFDLPYPDSLYLVDFGADPAYCRVFGYQSGNGVVYGAASGGTPDYTYEWVNLTDPDTTNSTTWGGLNPGTYQFTVTDDNGCTLVQTIELDSLNPIADFTMSSPDFTAEWEGTAPVDVHFVNNSINFANPNNPLADTTFFWNFGFGNWTISHDVFEEFDTTYTSGGTYDVCLVAINKNGCSDTLCVPVVIYDAHTFTPVNVFTPNGDGNNDEFTFDYLASSIVEFNCIIVNRWGRTITELNAITESWDGTDKSGSECKDGVYFYTYSGTAENGEPISGQGTIQLIRGE